MNRALWGKILLLLALAGCANTARLQEQAANHIQVGSAYLGSSQHTAALKEFLAAERLTPDDPRVHHLLGISYYGKGLPDMAIAEFKKALELKPDETEAYNYLGAIYLEQGRWDDAIAAFNSALANILYETPSAALYNLGRAHFEKGEYVRALKYFREAAEKNPESALSPLIEKNLGMCRYVLGETEEAVLHFRKAVALAPAFIEAHYWLGMSYLRLKKRGDAAQAFQHALRLAPDSEFGRKAKESLRSLAP